MPESNLWFVPALAFIAGLLTSLTPCSLTSLPIVMSYISGTKSSEKRKGPLTISLLSLWAWLWCTPLWGIRVLVGGIGTIWACGGTSLLAAVTVLMALHMFGIIDIIPDSLAPPKSVRKAMPGPLPPECWEAFCFSLRLARAGGAFGHGGGRRQSVAGGAPVAALCLGAQCLCDRGRDLDGGPLKR